MPLFRVEAIVSEAVVPPACCLEVEWDNARKESALDCLFQKAKLPVFYCVAVFAGQLYQQTDAIGVLWKGIHTYIVVQIIKEEVC